jgi:hypothetical protein
MGETVCASVASAQQAPRACTESVRAFTPVCDGLWRTRAAPKVQIVPAETAHVYALAANLRAGERMEAAALGIDPRRALRQCYRAATYVRTALVDGELAAMWGLGGAALADIGYPWLLTTAAVLRVPISMAVIARQEVAAMLRIAPRLAGHVAADYGQAVRFLALLGFTLDPPAPFGRRGEMFRRFYVMQTKRARCAGKGGV